MRLVLQHPQHALITKPTRMQLRILRSGRRTRAKTAALHEGPRAVKNMLDFQENPWKLGSHKAGIIQRSWLK